MAATDQSTGSITDPTGGAPNFDIQAIFESMGYTPSQSEIDALAPAFEGRTNVGQTGTSAVASYVQAHQQIAGAQSLIQGNLTAETGAASAATAAGNASYDAAQATLEAAPKLFGSMTPDQVSSYLAPLQNQFNYGLGQVTGQAASRGLAGSSLEAQAMAQAQTQYQQNIVNQGLSIGQQQQQLLASQQAGRGAQQLGLAPQFLGLANQSAGQNYGAATDIANLPGQSVSQSLAQQALLKQMSQSTGGGGWEGALGTGLGAVVGGIGGSFLGNPMLGASLGASLGGSAASAITGSPAGATFGSSASNPLLLGGYLAAQRQLGSTGASGAGANVNFTGGLNQSLGTFAPNAGNESLF
jgi:hypothetical protein